MKDDLEFTVEEWLADETARLETLARCTNSTIAAGAFAAAVKLRPKSLILMRHGARVIDKHPK